MIEYKNMKIDWLGHSGFRIMNDKKVIYIDPYNIKPAVPADIILITHEHHDHCNSEDVKKIVKNNTVIVTTSASQDKLRTVNAQFLTVTPGKSYSIDGIRVKAVPAYNIDKFRSSGVPYHPKNDGKVGFIISINDSRIYHAGDTDFISEMKKDVENIDIAMVPVSGTYVMTAEEAAKAVNTINPAISIPMHYGSIVGNEKDAYRFEKMVDGKVEVPDKARS